MNNLSYNGYQEWKNWSSAEFGGYSREDALYYGSECNQCGFHDLHGIMVLEIGFGNGSFSGWATGQGANYYGVEAILELVSIGRTRGFNTYASGTPLEEIFEAGSLDLVVAFDVLEHLDIADIKTFLRDAMKLLKPGGVVLARVPSGDSPFGRAIFHGDITHRTALGSSAVRQLAAQTGFDVIDIGPPKLPIFGLGWVRALRRGGICLAQSVITRLINLVFHDGQPRVITANLVFILKKPA